MAISKHSQTTGAARSPPKAGTNIGRVGVKMTARQMELVAHYNKNLRGKYKPQMVVESFMRKAQELKLLPPERTGKPNALTDAEVRAIQRNIHMLNPAEVRLLEKRLGVNLI